MNLISAIRSKIKLQEGSTKRGVSAVVTGVITLYLVFKGQPADSDAILQAVSGRVDFWIGVGLNVMGLLGIFIPDEPKTVKIELPPVELVGQTLSQPAPQLDRMADAADPVVDRRPAPERLRQHGMQSRPRPQLERSTASREDPPPPGFNG